MVAMAALRDNTKRAVRDGAASLRAYVNWRRSDPDSADSIDVDFIRRYAPLLDRFARFYLRMEVEGLSRVPAGPALLVGNHNAGITFIEPMGLGARWYLERGFDDLIHWLVHDAMLVMPGLSRALVRMGCVRAAHAVADQVLNRGRKVAVFPGGNLEAFRPYRQRHQVVFGGHQGFVRLALRHGVPIVPFVVVGGHESFFVLHDGRALARKLHLKRFIRSDTFPVFLGLPWGVGVGPIFHLHLPTKSQVRFLPPITMEGLGPEHQNDQQVVDDIYRRVTGVMQQAMQEIGSRRHWPVIG